MKTERPSKSNRRWAIVIGAGLALSPIHNQWLTELVTREGEVGFFLPAFGTAIWLIGTLAYVVWNWGGLDWGDKRVYIPLFIIVGAIGLSGITADRWQDKIAPLLMGLSLFALYLAARTLGKDLLLSLVIGAGVASLGVIAHGLLYPGRVTGGFVFGGNYDIVVGYVLLGMTVFKQKYQWGLLSLALVAMFLAGSPEGVFATVILGLVVLARKDWSRRLIAACLPAVLVAMVWFGLGYGQELYLYTMKVAKNEATVIKPQQVQGNEGAGDEIAPYIRGVPESKADQTVTGYRLWVIREALAEIKPFGSGYNVTAFREKIVHNVPIVIVQQLGYAGVLAGLAWLWVAVWCLVKTRWRYVWVLMLALSVFDHYTWTQIGTWWWAIVGASTASGIKSDLLFRRNKAQERYGRLLKTYQSEEL